MVERKELQELQELLTDMDLDEGESTRLEPFAMIELLPQLLAIEAVSEGVALRLSNGKVVKLQSQHYQQCCEHVYADWPYLIDILAVNRPDFSQFFRLEICGVKEMGILLRFIGATSSSYFVPCYNEQNGNYSGDLSILIDGQLYDASSFTKFVLKLE